MVFLVPTQTNTDYSAVSAGLLRAREGGTRHPRLFETKIEPLLVRWCYHARRRENFNAILVYVVVDIET